MSEKKLLANRQNSRKSTGPKSQAGKDRARLNAIKHGAYSKFCIEAEDLARFKCLKLDLLAEFQPIGFEELMLVNEIAETIWRKNRFKFGEALLIQGYSYAQLENCEQKGDIGVAIAQDAAAFGAIPICLAAEDRLDRRLWALFDRLKKLQKERRTAIQEPGLSKLGVVG